MRIALTVIVYDREKNVRLWCNIWKQIKSSYPNVELRVIHNVNSTESEIKFKDIVNSCGGVYIKRENIGMDIGALQDVSMSRLNGFGNNYDYLLWFTDDTLPIRRDFINQYTEKLINPRIGLVCYEISREVRLHARTTGFLISINNLRGLSFPANPVTTKDQCWRFEHRDSNNMYFQILNKGLDIVQIGDVKTSSIWDSGKMGSGNRMNEIKNNFKIPDEPQPKVIIISPAYKRYPSLISSLISQTYNNWELHIIHDGEPDKYWLDNIPNDKRVISSFLPRRENYGHPIRKEYLEKIKSGQIKGEYVLITNDDNYHIPIFIEKLVEALELDKNKVAAYCSMMAHNYTGMPYSVINSMPARGFIDCASVIVRSEIAADIGWPNYEHSSDWTYFHNIANKYGGWNNWVKVAGCLLVHN